MGSMQLTGVATYSVLRAIYGVVCTQSALFLMDVDPACRYTDRLAAY